MKWRYLRIATLISIVIAIIFRSHFSKYIGAEHHAGLIYQNPWKFRQPPFVPSSTEIITQIPEDAIYLCFLTNKSHSWEFRAIKYRLAIFLIPVDVDLDFEWSRAYIGFEMCGVEIMEQFLILDGLLVKAFTENYSKEFELWLKAANITESPYLELLFWEEEDSSIYDMINNTVKALKDL